MDQTMHKRLLRSLQIKLLQFLAKRLPPPETPDPDKQREQEQKDADVTAKFRELLSKPVELTDRNRGGYALSSEANWGIAAVALASIFQIMGTSTREAGTTLALYSFLAGFPALLAAAGIGQAQRDPRVRWFPWRGLVYSVGLQVGGLLFVCIGIIAFFWAYSGWAMIALLYFCLLAYRLMMRVVLILDEANPALTATGPTAKPNPTLSRTRRRLMRRSMRKRPSPAG